MSLGPTDEYKESITVNTDITATENTIESPRHIFDDTLYRTWAAPPSPTSTTTALPTLPLPQKSLLHNNKNINSDVKSTAAANAMMQNKNTAKMNLFDIEAVECEKFSIEYDNGIFCLSWSPDGTYLAVGCSDGVVRILNADGSLAYRVKTTGNMPVTALCWRPSLSRVGSCNTLVTTSSSGSIDVWHVQSQKSMYSILEQGNQIFCFDYSPNGSKFASAGMDKTIRIYDDTTKKLVCKLEKGFMAKHTGHSNRIFALKWKSDDENIVISGAWDSTVLFWDLRTRNCFRSIFGPHIAGQTVDIQNDFIVTGSWRIRETVQIWEFKTGKLVRSIPWDPSPMIYSCKFSPELDSIVAAGGTGINTMRLINIKTGQKSNPIQLNNKQGIYTMDWDPKGSKIAVAGHCADISIINVEYVKTQS